MVDSGASRHFTSYKEVLSNMVESETNLKIILGNNSTYPIKGSGYISFYLDQEVLYVPGLKLRCCMCLIIMILVFVDACKSKNIITSVYVCARKCCLEKKYNAQKVMKE